MKQSYETVKYMCVFRNVTVVQRVNPLESIRNYSFIINVFSINIKRRKTTIWIDVKSKNNAILRDK